MTTTSDSTDISTNFAAQLDEDAQVRLIVEVVKHAGRPISREEIEAALDVLDADYQQMMASAAIWEAWRQRWLELGVVDGEITLYPGAVNPDGTD